MTLIAVPEAKNYVKDGSPYLLYPQMTEAKSEGVSYAVSGTADDQAFPNRTTISWTLPQTAAKSGKPWGFPALSRGQPSSGKPKVLDPVKRLADLPSLVMRSDIDLTQAGDTAVLNDTFLYKDASNLKTDGRVLELGVFLRGSRAAWEYATGAKSKAIGSGMVTDPLGRRWVTRLLPANYCMFMPIDGDAMKSDIDLKFFFNTLISAGIAKSDMVYPGTAVGVEPASGSGMLVFNSFSVT